jgi:hypothetical protein
MTLSKVSNSFLLHPVPFARMACPSAHVRAYVPTGTPLQVEGGSGGEDYVDNLFL